MRTSEVAREALALLVVAASLAAGGCASTYAPTPLATPAELREVQQKTIAGVTVSVSILTDEEATRHFGVELAERDLQALWLSVRNASDRRLWFIRNVVDRDFYSADEAALLLESAVRRGSRDALHQRFRDESMRVALQPHTVTEGFIYLPRQEGGRYVDVRLQGDAYEATTVSLGSSPAASEGSPMPRELRFEFTIALPDGDFDYERLDIERTYAGQELPDLDLDGLRRALAELPCCVSDADGEGQGDPVNVVIIGEISQVLTALSRSGWSFTHRIDLRTIRRELGAAIAGAPYLVAPVSSLYLFGRSQDLALQRARRTIAQRNHMRIWLAPFRFEGQLVWVGQISRDIGIRLEPRSPTLSTHIIDPEIDMTREYLLHSLLAEGFVDRFGFVEGSAAGTPAEPRHNLYGDPYFSDGLRLIVILAREPVRPDEVRNLMWAQSAAPVAEGQSGAAQRNVRPIDTAILPSGTTGP